MTSEERHEARYKRRSAARQRKRDERGISFEEAFSFENLYKAGKECCKGVGWKASTQRYRGNLPGNIAQTHKALTEGKWKSKGFCEFDICERGKMRHIKSVHISERTVQKCLCENVLVPAFSPAFIYDNSASLKGKGVDFAMDRLNCHLQRHWRKHGTKGWALLFDFSDYFNSAPHAPIYYENARRIKDARIRALANTLMEDFGERGFGLGSQVSQINALMLPSRLDHFIKERLQIKGYGRYMDDGYLIHVSREYLSACLEKIRAVCADIGIKLNEKKTRIIQITKMRFLKTRFILTDTGRIIRRMHRKSAQRMRKKLKAFRLRLEVGRMNEEDVRTAYESWKGHMKRGNSYRVLRRMDRFYKKIILQGGQQCMR